MNFLSITLLAPAALIGLLALAVPIYLHMRHKPRAEVFSFPAIEFLLRAQKKRKKRFRVEQWILMAFRIGIILLLVFLFSKPFIDERIHDLKLGGNRPLIIVLDDSASMLAGEQGNRFFEQALNEISDLVDRRASQSPTILLPASAPQSLLHAKTAGDLEPLLAGIFPSTYAAVLDSAYQQAIELVDKEGWEQATLRIFTDGSLSAWRQFPNNKPAKIEVIYTALRDPNRPFNNIGIVDLAQEPGERNTLEVKVLNGNAESRDFDLRLIQEGSAGFRQPLRLGGFNHAEHSFALEDPLPATVEVRLPDDDFAMDNRALYAPRNQKLVKVLVVDGDSLPEAVNSESFFFKNALGLEESRTLGYQLEVVTPAGLTPAKIAEADVLCVLNSDVPNSELFDQHLKNNKGLFIALGDLMDRESWNQYFTSLGLEMWETKSLPAPQPIEIKSFDHPYFQPLKELDWRHYLEGVNIQQYRILGLGRSGFSIPLSLADGAPLLIAKDLQPGRVMIWSSTVDLAGTNFPLQFGYVPFVRQIVNHLAETDSSIGQRSMTVSQVATEGIFPELVLKHGDPAFEGMTVNGPVPGVYSREEDNQVSLIHVRLDARELDFRTLQDRIEEGASDDSLAQAGFLSHARADLAPSIQWILFGLLLFETLVASRFSLKWGGR